MKFLQSVNLYYDQKNLSALTLGSTLLTAATADFTPDGASGALKVSFKGEEVIAGSNFLQNGSGVFSAGELKHPASSAASPDFANRQKLTAVPAVGGTAITLPKELLRVYTIVKIQTLQ